MGERDQLAATERPNARSVRLDRLPTADVLALILDEDMRVAGAVAEALPALERATEALVGSLSSGGRWLNVGAGTSGRLGILDAVELPPTFGLPAGRVVGVLAGGSAAIEHAVEGAEDDAEAGAQALRDQRLAPGDSVIGISASGRTPFALGALRYAGSVGATTLAITCDADSPLARCVEIPIAIDVGPEVLTGSTRMKGGLAQKMVLHALSTTTMVRLGRVRGNLMSEIQIVNAKLWERAVRIVSDVAGVSAEAAREALEAERGSVSAALARLGAPDR